MKNVHLISTDKPSRLSDCHNNNLYLDDVRYLRNYLNIYITSDEEIKEGEWFLDDNNSIGQSYKLSHVQFANPKKIILTTDFDKQPRVQAIDDEFLEFFIKNPSCEDVEVEIESKFDRVDGHYHDVWEIIIPSKDDLKIGDNTNFGIITDINEKSVCFGKNKVGVDVWYKKSYVVKFPNLVLEEPKQETQGYICPQTKKQCDDECCVSAEDCHIEASFDIVSDCEPPKQETLEEAKIKHGKFCIENNIENPIFSFDKGAKWQQEQDVRKFSSKMLDNLVKDIKGQQERMYSQEEVIQLLIKFNQEIQEVEDVRGWFKQFKNK